MLNVTAGNCASVRACVVSFCPGGVRRVRASPAGVDNSRPRAALSSRTDRVRDGTCGDMTEHMPLSLPGRKGSVVERDAAPYVIVGRGRGRGRGRRNSGDGDRRSRRERCGRRAGDARHGGLALSVNTRARGAAMLASGHHGGARHPPTSTTARGSVPFPTRTRHGISISFHFPSQRMKERSIRLGFSFSHQLNLFVYLLYRRSKAVCTRDTYGDGIT
jgi:hypothetical protein